jgi:hypothetical protein
VSRDKDEIVFLPSLVLYRLARDGPQSPFGGSQTERGGPIGNEVVETANRFTADPVPRPRHHWHEESRFTARLGLLLSNPTSENGRTNN